MHLDERLRALPLVVLSTPDNPRDVVSCDASVANAAHVKPVGRGAHLNVLEQIFGRWPTQVTLTNHPGAAR